MLRWLKQRFGPHVIDDPVFGTIRCMKTPDPAKCYWEGSLNFTPVGSEVEVCVDGGPSGPDKEQRDLFQKIASRWTEIHEKVSPILIKEYSSWRQPDQPEKAEFTLGLISVPLDELPHMEWDLTFEYGADHDHIFVVQMKGWAPTGQVSIDG